MEYTYKDLIIYKQSLANIAAVMLPIKLSYAIAKNISIIGGHLKDLNNLQGEILKRYYAKDKEGKFIKENGRYILEGKEECQKELEKLLSTKVNVDLVVILESDLYKMTDANLSADQISKLGFMIISK